MLPEWQVNQSSQELVRVFEFKDFKSAFEFMTLCANLAEELDHHPDWSNAWNKVSVRLSTHSMKALTELDIAMASAMDQYALQVLG
ncbi:4a-hydroxytetrahydrobiopterin dehydratase [Polynucleobacter sp. 71A-WALBACH]|uniref:4a-hydroxytetrahydrobiopterin dehydratase n=1 Tax=Polynucleobacter sp. 71A-WALBACH TaxID=2689097 RepID=UPI002103B36D|nr:4a-hydroxytetrahydrobiopterin dehydratase [Polynucleobacter sp. 71A-WALBACH]